MKNNKQLTTLCLLLGLSSTSSFGYEEFFSAPGSRAMAMGGAFVGLADDGSAAWYNPAGLAYLYGADFTAEYGGKYIAKSIDWKFANGEPVVDEFGDQLTATSRGVEDEFKYLSWASGSNGSGLAISYFSPYKFYTPVPDAYTDSNIEEPDFYQTTFNQFSFAQGISMTDNLAIGYSLDLLAYSVEEIGGEDGKTEEIEGDNATFGFSVGALYQTELFELSDGSGASTFRAGALYRYTGEPDELSDFKTPVRPSSLAYGASITIPVKAVSIILSSQMETLTYVETTVNEYGNFIDDPDLFDYNEASRWQRYRDTDIEWQRASFGTEISYSTLLGQTPAQISFRAGMNSAVNNSSDDLTLDASFNYGIDNFNKNGGLWGINDGSSMYMAEQVDNTSFGAGLLLGNLFFEIAFEHRTIENKDIRAWWDNILGLHGTTYDAETSTVYKTNNEQDFVSFSLSYTF